MNDSMHNALEEPGSLSLLVLHGFHSTKLLAILHVDRILVHGSLPSAAYFCQVSMTVCQFTHYILGLSETLGLKYLFENMTQAKA